MECSGPGSLWRVVMRASSWAQPERSSRPLDRMLLSMGPCWRSIVPKSLWRTYCVGSNPTGSLPGGTAKKLSSCIGVAGMSSRFVDSVKEYPSEIGSLLVTTWFGQRRRRSHRFVRQSRPIAIGGQGGSTLSSGPGRNSLSSLVAFSPLIRLSIHRRSTLVRWFTIPTKGSSRPSGVQCPSRSSRPSSFRTMAPRQVMEPAEQQLFFIPRCR